MTPHDAAAALGLGNTALQRLANRGLLTTTRGPGGPTRGSWRRYDPDQVHRLAAAITAAGRDGAGRPHWHHEPLASWRP